MLGLGANGADMYLEAYEPTSEMHGVNIRV